MKNLLYLFSLLLIGNFILIGCNSDDNLDPITQVDVGVVINGVRWATRNVDRPGHFAATPESPGMLYQWNRRTAFPTTGEVTDWNRTGATGTSWERQNDPCPPGWRVPTLTEWNSLIANSSWTTRYGVSGRLFGVEPYQIFLPTTTTRYHVDGRLTNVGVQGNYWSATPQSGTANARNLFFGSGNNVSMAAFERANGLSVRCVAE